MFVLYYSFSNYYNMNNNKIKDESASKGQTDLRQQIEQWQDAYLCLSHDAALGRLFRGTIHNLNGVNQAFSMQAELLSMMFIQADDLLEHILDKTTESETSADLLLLRELLGRRATLVAQMKEKVQLARTIVRHSGNITIQPPEESRGKTVNEIINEELEFLDADLFFKHKVKKTVRPAADLPPLKKHHIEMHQIIFRLLINSLEAMQQSEIPKEINISTKFTDNKIKISITDSGCGIPPENLARIYDAFFTTKADHAGVGLYVAKKLIKRCGGAINCVSRPGATCFQLCFPYEM